MGGRVRFSKGYKGARDFKWGGKREKEDVKLM
jgi:hypothetical protein